MGKLKDMERN